MDAKIFSVLDHERQTQDEFFNLSLVWYATDRLGQIARMFVGISAPIPACLSGKLDAHEALDDYISSLDTTFSARVRTELLLPSQLPWVSSASRRLYGDHVNEMVKFGKRGIFYYEGSVDPEDSFYSRAIVPKNSRLVDTIKDPFKEILVLCRLDCNFAENDRLL